jgi:ADP-ribose pyrophosphatase YjhB (NUDIX family)
MPGDDIACVGAVILNAADELLVIQRGHEPAVGRWTLPGGRIEPGESAEQAVVREVLEETGLVVSVIREVGSLSLPAPEGGTYRIRDFLCALDPTSRSLTPCAGDDAAHAAFMGVSALRQVATTTGLLEILQSWGVLPPG